MRAAIALSVFFILIVTIMRPIHACSVFVLDDGKRPYYGSNFDWHSGTGYVVVNQRGLVKTGLPLPDDPGQPLQWRSTYGSVTFVQYGRGVPKGGINEAGLVIEGLLMTDTRYPPPDERPYIGSTSLFKQYVLDTCATVGEVIDRLSKIRVAAYAWAPGIHFMVADADGDCAVIAYIDGRTRLFKGRDLPVKALVNEFYPKSIDRQRGRPAVDAMAFGGSGNRMATLRKRLKLYRAGRPEGPVSYAMETLDQVSAGAYTQWRVLYDQQARLAYWRCAPDEPLRWIDLKKLNFSCGQQVLAIAVERPVTGEANAHLSSFTSQDNRNLVRQTLKESRSVLPVPEELWSAVWQWPEGHTCAAQ